MKKMMALLLCMLLFVGLVGCAVPVDDTSSTTPTTDAITTSTQPTTTTTTNWEGVGGYDMDNFLYENDYKFCGIRGYLYEYICENFDGDPITKIINEMVAAKNAVPYTFIGDSTHFWVHKFDIPREKFVELNNKEKEFYKDRPWFLENRIFTDEEINDIYTLSTKEFNEKYKAPTAVVVGDLIYNFNWFYKNDIDLWQKQSFTVEQLQDAVANAKATPNFPQGIVEVVEKKLNEYIQTVNP